MELTILYPLLFLIVVLLLVLVKYRKKLHYLVRYLSWRLFKLNKRNHQKGHVFCSNAEIYYERYQLQHDKDSETIILLHGGLATIEAWYSQLPLLSEHYTIICVDLRGHGRSTLGKQTSLTYRLMADDIVTLMQKLHIPSANIIGWSDGANVGLILAVEHAASISRLIAISANFHPSGVTATALNKLDRHTAETHNPMAKYLYRYLSPEPRWQSLWLQVTEMWKTRPQLSADDLQEIKLPTLLMAGEFDDIVPAHTQEMHSAIPNAEICIIPNVGHSLIQDASSQVNAVMMDFLSRTTFSKQSLEHKS